MSRRCCVVAAPHAQTARKENHNVNVRVLTRESSFNFPSVRPTAGRGPSHFTAAACGRQAPPWHGGRASAARVPGGRSAAGGRSGAAPAVLPHQPTAGPFFFFLGGGGGGGGVNYVPVQLWSWGLDVCSSLAQGYLACRAQGHRRCLKKLACKPHAIGR